MQFGVQLTYKSQTSIKHCPVRSSLLFVPCEIFSGKTRDTNSKRLRDERSYSSVSKLCKNLDHIPLTSELPVCSSNTNQLRLHITATSPIVYSHVPKK